MGVAAVWPGTDRELADLRSAVQHNCTCEIGQPTCPPHEMLTDQRILGHLVFARRVAQAWLEGEGAGEP